MKTYIIKSGFKANRYFKKYIKQGEIVAFPTETVYGLGADATNDDAVQKIFIAKGRPSDNPLIVHVSKKKDIKKYVVKISKIEKKIIKYFMPGPISLVLTKNCKISNLVSAGGNTLAFRIPENKIARSLISYCNKPICAPSANTSKRPSPTTANHVFEDLNGKIPLIIDGGQTDIGIESTVVKVCGDCVKILRPGKILKEELEKRLNVKVEESGVFDIKRVESPGVKYPHYMPKCEMVIAKENDYDKIKLYYDYKVNQGKKVVIFCKDDDLPYLKNHNCKSLGFNSNEACHNLYKFLRENEDNDLIIAIEIKNGNMFKSFMNRLDKAASGKKI